MVFKKPDIHATAINSKLYITILVDKAVLSKLQTFPTCTEP